MRLRPDSVAGMTRRRIADMHIETGGAPWGGSVSVGVATRTPEMRDPDAQLEAADRGAYAAKLAGKNRVRCCGLTPPPLHAAHCA